MGMIFHALGNRVHMVVDNPGYGEVIVCGFTDDGDVLSVAGPQLGRLLEETTRRALGADPGQDPLLPRSITGAQAGELMPNLQRAVLLAVGATERYERVVPEVGKRPAGVLCVDCNQGSTFHQVVTISETCTQYGHTPFGYPAGTTWDQAQTLAAAAQRPWDCGRPQG